MEQVVADSLMTIQQDANSPPVAVPSPLPHRRIITTATQMWPITFNILLLVALVIYLGIISPILSKAISAGYWNRSWSLNATSISYLRPKSNTPYSRAYKDVSAIWRGVYNCYLLPTIPFIDLTIGQCLALLIYMVFVLLATFAQEGRPDKDLLRSGRIAVAQTPVLFALATKNNLLGIFGKTYEKLNFIHRFAGRCVFFCSAIHTVGFLKRIIERKRLNLLSWTKQGTGFFAFMCLVLLLVTSFRFVRKAAYRVFLYSHIIGWIFYIAAIYVHVPYCKPWVIGSLCILGADFMARMYTTRMKKARIIAKKGGITQIKLEGIRSGWKAGQHVWVRRMSGRYIFEPHPFTIANASEYDLITGSSRGLVLYAKDCGGWTKSLHEHASIKSVEDVEGFESHLKLSVEGPYGASYYELSAIESVMLVAGGSGITFVLSAVEDLIATELLEPEACITRRIKIVFTTQDLVSNSHFVIHLENLLLMARVRCTSIKLEIAMFDTGPNVVEDVYENDPTFTGVMSQSNGRPNIKDILEEFLVEAKKNLRGGETGGSVILATCGPASLVNAVGLVIRVQVSISDFFLHCQSRKAAKDVDQLLAYTVGGVIVQSEKFGW